LHKTTLRKKEGLKSWLKWLEHLSSKYEVLNSNSSTGEKRKKERSQINSLIFYLKELEKREQIKSKDNRRKKKQE
jgi:hypothetical protein